MRRPYRLLVVDDDPIFRRLLHIVLDLPDFVIVGEAEDGMAAIEAISQDRPDVVLMDYNMPLMNGLETARRMLQFPNCPAIVLLTSNSSAEVAAAARRMGVCDILPKGIDVMRLGPAVLAAIGLVDGTLECTV